MKSHPLLPSDPCQLKEKPHSSAWGAEAKPSGNPNAATCPFYCSTASPIAHTPLHSSQPSQLSQRQHCAALGATGTNFQGEASWVCSGRRPAPLECSKRSTGLRHAGNLFVRHIPHNARGKNPSANTELNKPGFQILFQMTQSVLASIIFTSRIQTYIDTKT